VSAGAETLRRTADALARRFSLAIHNRWRPPPCPSGNTHRRRRPLSAHSPAAIRADATISRWSLPRGRLRG